MTRGRMGLVGLLVVVAGGVAAADEVTEIKLGQGIWRAEATTAERTLPDGSKRRVQVDLYGLVMEREEPVRLVLWAEGRLGLVVRALDRNDAQGNPALVGIRTAGQSLETRLAAGRYMLAVAAEPPERGAYLLAAARPLDSALALPAAELAPAGGKCPLVGSFALPAGVRQIDLSPDGRRLVCGDGRQGWLFDLEQRRGALLPAAGGPLLRVALSPDGWSLMTVTEREAVLWALPDLAPFARFTAASGLRDAVYAGRHSRVAVLPQNSPVYVSSPVEGDLAFLPGSRGGQALVADAAGTGLLVRSGDRDLALYDLSSRQLLGRTTWPATPRQLAVHPAEPLVIGTGPGANQAWRAGGDATIAQVPEADAVAFALNGALALGGAGGVSIRKGTETVPLTPAVPVVRLRFGAGGSRLVALDGAGRLLVWDTTALSGGAPQDVLRAARQAYAEGLGLLRQQKYAEAHPAFARSLANLRQLPAQGEIVEFTCLTILRLSQCSYGAGQFGRSLAEAEELLQTSETLPDGSLKRSNLAMGWYRRADALWELGRRQEARPAYQKSLDLGLEGAAAADARQKVKATP